MSKINTYKKLETPLQTKTFQFAVRIVKLCQHIKSTRQEFEMTKQLFRSGTNPGAMVREALNAESGLDFIHKLGVAQKETGETQYWLELMEKTGYLSKAEFDSIYTDSEEVMKLVRSSILTKKKSMAIKTSSILAIFITLYYFIT